jgi:hypothetical protein
MLLTQLIDQPFGLTNSTKILNAKKEDFATDHLHDDILSVVRARSEKIASRAEITVAGLLNAGGKKPSARAV